MDKHIEPDILHIEATNFIDHPTGGQLNFSRQLMRVFGNRIALAGWATSPKEPIGQWFKKEIDGTFYKYFAFGREISAGRKPFIPSRFKTFIQIKRHQMNLFSIGIPNIILSEHAILMGLKPSKKHNICYRFPGVESPLSISRYSFAKWLSIYFDKSFYKSLITKSKCILAAADNTAIKELKNRSQRLLDGIDIISFPTRVDTDIFHPADKIRSRKKLGLPSSQTIAVAVSRIHWAKGWKFLINAFKIFHDKNPDSLLIFIGDGSEKAELESYVDDLGLNNKVIVAGRQPSSSLAIYLQAADQFIMGSLKEGWSTVLVEALSCHLPIVTTRFSSADTIVQHGVNGFVVERDPERFANAMVDVKKLKQVTEFSKNQTNQYALANLKDDLLQTWLLS